MAEKTEIEKKKKGGSPYGERAKNRRTLNNNRNTA